MYRGEYPLAAFLGRRDVPRFARTLECSCLCGDWREFAFGCGAGGVGCLPNSPLGRVRGRQPGLATSRMGGAMRHGWGQRAAASGFAWPLSLGGRARSSGNLGEPRLGCRVGGCFRSCVFFMGLSAPWLRPKASAQRPRRRSGHPLDTRTGRSWQRHVPRYTGRASAKRATKNIFRVFSI